MSEEVYKPEANFISVHGAVPKTRELFECFSKVMGSFAYLSCQPAGVPGIVLQALPLEMTVGLKAPGHTGTLVVRTTEKLPPYVLEAASGEVEEDSNPEDAFKEMVNLFCGHLLTDCFQPRGIEFGFFLPRISTPTDWPLRPADSACALLVENHPVEIRLWVDPAEKQE